MLGRLGGGGAPALYDRGLHEGRPYLIIEWCNGMDAGTAASHRRHVAAHCWSSPAESPRRTRGCTKVASCTATCIRETSSSTTTDGFA